MSKELIWFVVLWGIAMILLISWGDMNLWSWVRLFFGSIFAALAGVMIYIDLDSWYKS